MVLHLEISGILLMVLAWLHIIFPRYFKWRSELSSVSHINREMMYVHTFFIALVVFLMGWLSYSCSYDLLNTALGRKVTLGLGIFWTARLLAQFFGYSSRTWRGKKLETTVHIFFTLLWIYLSIVFLTTSFSETRF